MENKFKSQQQEVQIYLRFPVGKFDSEKNLDAIFQLEEILAHSVETNGLGRFDGNEFCDSPDESSVTFFIYGTNADSVCDVLTPFVVGLPFLSGSHILKRYGVGNDNEMYIPLKKTKL